MVLRTLVARPNRVRSRGPGRRWVERHVDADAAAGYSLAVHLLEDPSVGGDVALAVLSEMGRAGPPGRARLVGEVHRRAVLQLRDRPRRCAPDRIEVRAWNGIADQRIRDVLSGMPTLARRALLLVYFGGYRIRELAATLNHEPDELRTALRTAVTILSTDPRTSRTQMR